MQVLSTALKNKVLLEVGHQLSQLRQDIILANQEDLKAWSGKDQAMYDRLIANDKKIDGMLQAIQNIHDDEDPVGKERYHFDHENGLKISNRTAPFGTVLIIYESRPDVTIEAAMVAFKSSNRILLKGGKEAIHTNRILVSCWHRALEKHGLAKDWVRLLEYDRQRTQEFLKSPDVPLDLIVPRGGEGLISFVNTHASCPVLISGRGNNFIFVDKHCDWPTTKEIILNAKTDKISACNALDKILLHKEIKDKKNLYQELIDMLREANVDVLMDANIASVIEEDSGINLETEWPTEYLALKVAIGEVEDIDVAVSLINRHSGGHSAAIMTTDESRATQFMDEVDAAAVYHNASTRFTDGGAFGMGAELAISTDKLHHRGPLGLSQLVTNKWYVFGSGQIRK